CRPVPVTTRRAHQDFSCDWHADRPALPSFPTRRSSDLQQKRGEIGGVERMLDRAEHLAAIGGDDRRSVALQRMAERVVRGQEEPDRKSTRLNSSHDQISYAVFCLKKKANLSDELPTAAL